MRNQTLIAVENVQGRFDTAGVFGLGWPTLSTSRGNPWWINALDQFDQPEFGLYLTSCVFTSYHPSRTHYVDRPSNATITPAGQFTLGGRNESLLNGEPQFVHLLEQSFWAIPLTQITTTTAASMSSIDTDSDSSTGATVSLTGDDAVAILDCGSRLITGPKLFVDAVYSSIEGAVKSDHDDTWHLRTSLLFTGLWLTMKWQHVIRRRAWCLRLEL